jgi:hypothetical protein
MYRPNPKCKRFHHTPVSCLRSTIDQRERNRGRWTTAGDTEVIGSRCWSKVSDSFVPLPSPSNRRSLFGSPPRRPIPIKETLLSVLLVLSRHPYTLDRIPPSLFSIVTIATRREGRLTCGETVTLSNVALSETFDLPPHRHLRASIKTREFRLTPTDQPHHYLAHLVVPPTQIHHPHKALPKPKPKSISALSLRTSALPLFQSYRFFLHRSSHPRLTQRRYLVIRDCKRLCRHRHNSRPCPPG